MSYGTEPGLVTVTFDPRDPVSVLRALREAVGRDVLKVVADAEALRGEG
jgi:hypothetical protein